MLYSRKFTGPIREIAEIYGELQSSLAAAERVFKVIDEPPEPADLENAAPLENAQGDVELSHVSFGYQKDQVILKDFSMKAPKGSPHRHRWPHRSRKDHLHQSADAVL